VESSESESPEQQLRRRAMEQLRREARGGEFVERLENSSFAALPPLPSPRSGCVAATLGQLLVCAGGGDDASPLADTDILDTAHDRPEWLPDAPLLIPRALHGGAALGQDLWVVGGFDGDGVLSSTEVWRLGRPWRAGPDLDVPRAGHAVVALGGRLYALGGIAGQVCASAAAAREPPR